MSSIFESSVKWKILGYFLQKPWKQAYVKQIAKELGVGAGSASTLCKKLEKEKLLKSETKGNLLFYALNKENFMVMELVRVYILHRLKKVGFKEKMINECDEIISLAIYGSYVKGNIDEKSDLDVLVITNSKADFAEVLRSIRKEIKIDVNINLFTLREWKKLAEKNDIFYREVISGSVLLYGSGLVI